MEVNKEKLFTLNYNIFLTLSLLLLITLTGLQFLIPLHILDIGGGEAMVGFAAGLTLIVGVISRPFYGVYIDLHGCRKILLINIVFYCLSTFLLIAAQKVILVIVLRALQGFAFGGMMSALFTLAAELAPLTRQGEAMGYFAIAPPISNAVGPLMVEFLYWNYSYVTTIVIIGIITLTALLLTCILKEDNSRIIKKVESGKEKQPWIAKSVMLSSILVLVVHFGFGAIVTFMPVVGQVREITNIGLFFTLYGLILVITRPFSGKLVEKIGYFYIISASLFFIIVSMVVIAYANTLTALLIAAFILSVGTTVSYPALMKLTVDLSSEEERGRAMATFTAAMDIGMGIGVMGLGYLLSISSITILYLTCSIILLGNLLYVLFPWRSRLKNIGSKPGLSQDNT